jgi:hypothetical protein
MCYKSQRIATPLHLLLLLLFALFSLVPALEVPLEFHGGGFFGKYLNSDTSRYNLDASFSIYCTILRYGAFSTYIYYRDDLDMAEQTGGVSIDPRYTHYYIVGGLDYFLHDFTITGYFVHDCIHDIDYDVEGTPVFNRFRLRLAPQDFHYSKKLRTDRHFLWSVDLGYYPTWKYHGWDINSGADYRYDVMLLAIFTLLSSERFGLDFRPNFTVAKGDTTFYHQHVIGIQGYYRKNSHRIGLSLDYNLYNNDPLKSPDRLWLFSIYLEF